MIEVVAGIILSDKKVLLAKRKEGKSLAGYWEFPGGKIEPNESPIESLKRELREEFEIEVEIISKFHENTHAYETKVVNLQSFLVKYISGEYKLNDHSEILWADIEDILKYNLALADIPIATKLLQLHSLDGTHIKK